MDDEARQKIESAEDYVYLARFQFSMKKLLERYPDGVPNRLIAQGLLLTEDEVEAKFQAVIRKIRRALKVTVGE